MDGGDIGYTCPHNYQHFMICDCWRKDRAHLATATRLLQLVFDPISNAPFAQLNRMVEDFLNNEVPNIAWNLTQKELQRCADHFAPLCLAAKTYIDNVEDEPEGKLFDALVEAVKQLEEHKL